MIQRTATSFDVTASYDRARHDRRSPLSTLFGAFRTLIVASVIVVAVAVGGAWLVSLCLGAKSDLRIHSPMQLEKHVTLSGPYGARANTIEPEMAEASMPPLRRLRYNVDAILDPELTTASIITRTPFAPVMPLVLAKFETPPVPAAPAVVPPKPAPGPRLASIAPSELYVAPPPRPHDQPIDIPDVDEHTAIYDISARTVYLPSGRRLEAHSGLGEKMDDPRFVHVRMRGATPPNTYALTLREQIFHGVRALRLTPIGGGNMYGRDGILAHTYMLGPNGQSNGCVSFEDYDAFLRAFLKGEVTRMVVVPHLPHPPARALVSSLQRDERYAAASY
jgi:hypothetical protein